MNSRTAWGVVAVVLLLEIWWGLAEAREPRDRGARSAFVASHPCPSTGKPFGACPGYIVDHVKALACGGADDPSNMQWQTVADSCAKDRVELAVCGKQYLFRPGQQCRGF